MVESDDDLRARVLREWERNFGPPPSYLYFKDRHGLEVLDCQFELLREQNIKLADPFGDAVRSAQERPEAPDPTYRPDDFTAPGFDADAAWKRAMGGGA